MVRVTCSGSGGGSTAGRSRRCGGGSRRPPAGGRPGTSSGAPGDHRAHLDRGALAPGRCPRSPGPVHDDQDRLAVELEAVQQGLHPERARHVQLPARVAQERPSPLHCGPGGRLAALQGPPPARTAQEWAVVDDLDGVSGLEPVGEHGLRLAGPGPGRPGGRAGPRPRGPPRPGCPPAGPARSPGACPYRTAVLDQSRSQPADLHPGRLAPAPPAAEQERQPPPAPRPPRRPRT